MERNGNGLSSTVISLPNEIKNDLDTSIKEWKYKKKMPTNHLTIIQKIEEYIQKKYGKVETHLD